MNPSLQNGDTSPATLSESGEENRKVRANVGRAPSEGPFSAAMLDVARTPHESGRTPDNPPSPFTSRLPVGYPAIMLRIDPRWVSATKGTTFGAGLFVRVVVF